MNFLSDNITNTILSLEMDIAGNHMKIAIIEDNPLDSEALLELIQEYSSHNSVRAEIIRIS